MRRDGHSGGYDSERAEGLRARRRAAARRLSLQRHVHVLPGRGAHPSSGEVVYALALVGRASPHHLWRCSLRAPWQMTIERAGMQGAHYVRHCDNPNINGRVLTAIYYMNTEWHPEDGGQLRIYSCLKDAKSAEGFTDCDGVSLQNWDTVHPYVPRLLPPHHSGVVMIRVSSARVWVRRGELGDIALSGAVGRGDGRSDDDKLSTGEASQTLGAPGVLDRGTVEGSVGEPQTSAVKVTDVEPLGDRLLLFYRCVQCSPIHFAGYIGTARSSRASY